MDKPPLRAVTSLPGQHGKDDKTAILLLYGGDKRNQAKDIERAHEYWKDYKNRERTVPRGGPP